MTLLQLDVPFVGESPMWVTVTLLQLSRAVTDKRFGAGTAEKHWTVTAVGQLIKGGVVSLTVSICVQVPTFPQASTP